MPSFVRHRMVWALLAVVVGWTVWHALPRSATEHARVTPMQDTADATAVARGAYLARLGNCALCHTARGGVTYAGGRDIDTPFGAVFSSNITPDPQHGIGTWSSDDFWRALHWGESRDGHWLTPAFPYTSFTHITRGDADALYVYLMSLPPSSRANTPHSLSWPYNTQAALGVWRTLFFTPGNTDASMATPQSASAPELLRGAYLVQGLGHCSACHTERNALGAIDEDHALAGGMIPAQNWYAPSLRDTGQASVASWSEAEIVTLLQTGSSPRGNALGPMAEVVLHSTQYLSNADARAMVHYLKSLPAGASHEAAPLVQTATVGTMVSLGASLYDRHCAECHGKQGQGIAKAYPALAGNHTVTAQHIHNLVQMVWRGGFAPATAANPRPFGMPPFQQVLNDKELAAVLTYVRTSWGNQAGPVSEFDINQLHRLQAHF